MRYEPEKLCKSLGIVALACTLVFLLIGSVAATSQDKKTPVLREDSVRGIKSQVFKPAGAGEEANDASLLIESFKARYGKNSQIIMDWNRNQAVAIDGKFPSGLPVYSNETADAASRQFITENSNLLRIVPSDIRLTRVVQNSRLERYRIDYEQYHQGVRVELSRTRVFVSGDGTITSVRNGFHPTIDLSVIPRIDEAAAVARAIHEEYGESRPQESFSAELVILPVETKDARTYHLCWKVSLVEYAYFVDANTGEIVSKWSRSTRDMTYTGKIRGETYPLTNPTGATSQTDLDQVSIWFDQNSATATDANRSGETNASGDYSITQAAAANHLYTRLQSEQVRVIDVQGAAIDHTYTYGSAMHDYDFPDSPGNQANVFFNIVLAWKEFNSRFSHSQPQIEAWANDNNMGGNWGVAYGTYVRYQPIIGQYSWTIQHELTHCVVWDVHGNNWINHPYDENWWCMDEAFAVYFPCTFIGSSVYTTPTGTWDISTNTGLMTIGDQNGDGNLTEDDHHFYWSRYAVAAAWWQLAGSMGEAAWLDLQWDALEHLPDGERHPRNFFWELMTADDDDNNLANGSPHIEQIDEAYRNHGMNYWPTVYATDAAGTEGVNLFAEGDKVYVKGSGLPTNEVVRIYVVDNNNMSSHGGVLVDVSGGYETATVDASGSLPLTEVWDLTGVNIGNFDIVVDIDEDGLFDFDHNLIDGCDDWTEAAGFSLGGSVAAMDFENGVDAAVISSTIPGMNFTTTAGYDWVYGDKSTGNYNVYPYGSAAYYCHGNFFAWLGPNQGQGRIDFTGATTTAVSARTSSYNTLHIEAYDVGGTLVDSDEAPGNLYTNTMGEFSVAGDNIAYILIHDEGNYWLIDDLVVVDLLREAAALLPAQYSTLMQYLETINPGVTSAYNFQIEGLAHDLEIILHWGGSEFALSLYGPDGQRRGRWLSDSPPLQIHIPSAMPGQWRVEVTAVEIPSADYPFALVVGGKAVENTAPVANAGRDSTYECIDGSKAEVRLDGTGSYDPDGDPLTYLWSASGVTLDDPTSPTPDGQFPLGTTLAILTVSDSQTTSMPDTVFITVEDTTPPGITVELNTYVLWPPNHKTVDITATVTTTDICCDAPTFELVSIASNEPDNGKGDGNTIGDIKEATFGRPDVAFQLRAERSGTGTGRIYTIIYAAEDCAGNTAYDTVQVCVPLDGSLEEQDQQLPGTPSVTALLPSHPNPFNPTTTIPFDLATQGRVSLQIFDTQGRLVRTLCDEVMPEGTHEVVWDGRDNSGSRVATGVYFVRFTAGNYQLTKKLVMVR